MESTPPGTTPLTPSPTFLKGPCTATSFNTSISPHSGEHPGKGHSRFFNSHTASVVSSHTRAPVRAPQLLAPSTNPCDTLSTTPISADGARDDATKTSTAAHPTARGRTRALIPPLFCLARSLMSITNFLLSLLQGDQG